MTPSTKLAIANDPVRYVAGKALMYWLSFQAQIKCNGYQLEHYFEPEQITESKKTGLKVRSCKYDRYLQMRSFPSAHTLTAIEHKIPGSHQLLAQEIWQSLVCNPPHKTYWAYFYQNLRPSLQRHVFRIKPSANKNYEQKRMRSLTVNAIYREGDQQALACLIALMRQARESNHIVEYETIEARVYNLLFFVLSFEPYFSVRHEILHQLKEHIVENNNNLRMRESPWNISEIELNTKCLVNRKNILLAEDLGLASTEKEMREFFYWKSHGNIKLIVNEMVEAYQVQEYQLPNTCRGLKWLITEINKSRSPTKKLPTDIL